MAPLIDLCAGVTGTERPELAFVRVRLARGAAILDIGAGVGELAFALAAEGYRVTALEPDDGMYGALLVRLAPRDDLRTALTPVPRAIGFELQQRFDVCLALAVLHHLDPTQRRALFVYAAAHLRGGGFLLIDAPVEGSARTETPRQLRAERTFGATRFQHWHTVVRSKERWQTTWEFVTLRGDDVLDRRSRTFDWATSSCAEVTTLAQKAGLKVEETFAGFDGAPFLPGESRALIAVARKPR